MLSKVTDNMAALRENGTPAGEIRVLPSPVGPSFFSNCSPLIPPRLSALLHAQLHKGRFINATHYIIGGWAAAGWLRPLVWLRCRVQQTRLHPGSRTSTKRASTKRASCPPVSAAAPQRT